MGDAIRFSEDDMADVVVAHTEKLLGEPLTLLARKHWIGRYELDLLFEDRHGAKLIVELQRGPLDRYHLYKVLDYYDQYKERYPDQFVEVAVVANVISPERKSRLAARGVSFREIPADVITRHLAERPLQCSDATPEDKTQREVRRTAADLIGALPRPVPPKWFSDQLEVLNAPCRELVTRWLGLYPPRTDDEWRTHAAAIPELKRWSSDPGPTFGLLKRILNGSASIMHSHAALGGFDAALDRWTPLMEPDLARLVLLHRTTPPSASGEFFRQREETIGNLVAEAIRRPAFLLDLCGSLRSLWTGVVPNDDRAGFYHCFQLASHFLADVVRELSLRLFHTQAVPIGIDASGRYEVRNIKLNQQSDPVRLFRHLVFILSMPGQAHAQLWNDGEIPSTSYEGEDGVFPDVSNPFGVGTEMLITAYGNKAYTIATPSEVLLGVGAVKSITLLEIGTRCCAYKVRYRDDSISFGQVGLDAAADSTDLLAEHYSTSGLMADVYCSPSGLVPREAQDELRAKVLGTQGIEFAIVSTLVRDFFVCEDRERYYNRQQLKRRALPKRQGGLIVRYLPRFRVRYIGVREPEYSTCRFEVNGHHVSGHLRRCRSASPRQLEFAKEFDVQIPDGFTFVRPHDRGGHERVLYRSRSALELLYGSRTH